MRLLPEVYFGVCRGLAPFWSIGNGDARIVADESDTSFHRGADNQGVTQDPTRHHSVYVVLLDDTVGPRRNPEFPSVYVGMTGLTPEERFANHKAGYKASNFVRDHGVRLMPEVYAHRNPMSYSAAGAAEKLLALELLVRGYTVYGGH